MTLRKKILLSIMFIPFILLLLVLVSPVREGDQHNTNELLFLIIGLPILLVNYLEWSDPQLLDEFLGKSWAGVKMGPMSIPLKNMLDRFAPQGMPVWKSVPVLISVLLLGIVLGAGALFIMNQRLHLQTAPGPGPSQTRAKPAPTEISAILNGTSEANATTGTQTPHTPSPTIAGSFSTAVGGSNPVAASPTTENFSTPATPTATEDISIPATPTATRKPTVTGTPPVTPNLSRCASATQIQIAAIRLGIKILDTNYDIKTAYVVQSLAVDGLYFFAAKVYSPDLDGGVTVEPAVWSFNQTNDNPSDIYAVNDIAFQYSDFNLGQLANPPINMQINGADIALLCSQSGN